LHGGEGELDLVQACRDERRHMKKRDANIQIKRTDKIFLRGGGAIKGAPKDGRGQEKLEESLE